METFCVIKPVLCTETQLKWSFRDWVGIISGGVHLYGIGANLVCGYNYSHDLYYIKYEWRISFSGINGLARKTFDSTLQPLCRLILEGKFLWIKYRRDYRINVGVITSITELAAEPTNVWNLVGRKLHGSDRAGSIANQRFMRHRISISARNKPYTLAK